MTHPGIHDVDFADKRFWRCFFRAEWGNAYDEATDTSAGEFMDEECPLSENDLNWWHNFTGYREDLFEMSDGYAENPAAFEAELDGGRVFRIEFHPGDTVYYIDGQEIGCTGPHERKIKPVSYREAAKWLGRENGEAMFCLLLPMARLEPKDAAEAQETLASLLTNIFDRDVCAFLAGCIADSLKE